MASDLPRSSSRYMSAMTGPVSCFLSTAGQLSVTGLAWSVRGIMIPKKKETYRDARAGSGTRHQASDNHEGL